MFWHEDKMVVAYGCRKTRKLICDKEGEILWFLAACLPPLLHRADENLSKLGQENVDQHLIEVNSKAIVN